MSEPVASPPGPPRRPRFRRAATSARIIAMAYAGTVAEGVVFLLLTPFLVRRLGLASYGVWTLGLTLADWLQLLDLGLREAIVKYAAAHQARLENAAIRRVAETALAVYTAIGGLALAAAAGFAWLAAPRMVDPSSVFDLRVAIVVLGLSAAISFPAGVAGTLLEGLLRFDLINVLRMGHALLRLVLVVIALQFETGIVGVALAELTSRVVLHALRWGVLLRVYPHLVVRPRLDLESLRRLFGFGIWNSLRQGVEVLTSKLYEPLLALFAGVSSVGAFYAGRRLAAIPAEAIVPLAGVLFPLTSELEAGGRDEALKDSLLKATKFAWTLTIPVALVLALGAAPIQANWLGGRAPAAEGVLQVFSAVFLVVAVVLPAEAVLLGLGHSRLLALCGFLQAAITITLGVPLIAAYGAEGLAWSALAGVVFAQAVVQIPMAAKRCGFEVWAFFRKAILPGALAGASVGAGLWLLRDEIAFGGLAALAAWAGGGVMTYVLLMWFFGLDRDEKAFFQLHVRRLFLSLQQPPQDGGAS